VISSVKDFHENPKSNKCDTCRLRFKEKKGLNSHRKIHIENRSKPFKCLKYKHATHYEVLNKKHLKSHERIEKKDESMKSKAFSAYILGLIG